VRSTIPVAQGPQGVAINPAAHSAVVTNSGFIKGVFTPGANSSTSASIINLDWDQAEGLLSVGTAPFGVAISGDTVVIANYGSNDVTIIRPYPNPVPHISAMQPKVFPAGADSLTVNIAGTGFNPLSIAKLNGDPLATLFISPTALQAVVTADIVD